MAHEAEYHVGTLARLTGASPAATSQHLAKPRLTGLVAVRRDGRRRPLPAASRTCPCALPPTRRRHDLSNDLSASIAAGVTTMPVRKPRHAEP